MTENSTKVWSYLKDVQAQGQDVTAEDVATALGKTKQSINGTFTRSIQTQGLGYREEVEIELEDGTHKTVKFLRLNDKGMAFDPSAEPESK